MDIAWPQPSSILSGLKLQCSSSLSFLSFCFTDRCSSDLHKKYEDPRIKPATGCSLKIVFFSKILKYIPDSDLSRFPLGVSVCTQWQVKHRHCSRTCRIQKKSQNFKEKTQCLMNTLYLTSGCPIIQGRARNVGNTVVDKLFNYIYASSGLLDFLLHNH